MIQMSTIIKWFVANETSQPSKIKNSSLITSYNWLYPAEVKISLKIEWLCERTNMFHNYETEKITCKAIDTAENLQLYRVVWFFRPRLLCTTTHLMLFSERPPIYTSCMTLGARTEQHVRIGFGELAAVN